MTYASDSSESDSDWIEVESSVLPDTTADLDSSVTSHTLEITLQSSVNKRKQSMIDRCIKLYERAQKIRKHNTHLMLLLGRLELVSRLCSDQLLQSAVLSLLPLHLTTHSHTNLQNVLLWFQQEYQASQLDEEVRNSIEKYQLTDLHSLVALLRSLGYRTRIVNNMIATPVREERGNKQQSRNKKRGGSREQLSTSCDKSPYFQSNAKQSRSQQFKRPRSVRMNHTASDEEFETPKKIRKKLVATDREACISHSDKYIDEWLEISVEEDWVPVHCKLCKLTNAYSCVELATPNSFQYVVASEREGKVRDVSARYCLDWGGKYAKMKPDNDSWLRILSLWCDSRDEEDRLEDKQLMSIQLSLPSPSTLSQYKCNPIYILERHILKFQAIYPADVLPVGIFRGDRVYHRDNVMELHTRENWLKEGRVISKGSTAYKLARGRTKPGSDPKQERKIELFGKWQTEIYIAPPVVDGKVPKNEFGNVELFQESMLPSGAAHVDIPGAAIVARKLGIDYALAMVGWEFHGIACHPVFRGVVVATENEGVLLEAWREGKEEKREKEKVVREKKVFERWRRVIRSALIKQRVDKKYKFTDNQMD
ncbi:DNA repair protein complementing XP-C cells-like [Oopsacas minuta]|uniref:DNA repair protein complementing XP-C cells-like n=1 Tax=Oopsacas minuta TaxID=111878 RepID=A0AAV7JFL9_9METZ|nr:DNA repair protein complementing XP-C cells-like [Oopsacas minuta]